MASSASRLRVVRAPGQSAPRGSATWILRLAPGVGLVHHGRWTDARARAERLARERGLGDVTFTRLG